MVDRRIFLIKSGFQRLLTSLPAWVVNLIVFGILIGLILAYFLYQVHQSKQQLIQHVKENAAMLAGVIELNARSAVLFQQAVEQIIHTFLDNAAKFVAYLNSVAPFSSEELASFASESGLAGIRIIHKDGTIIEGPHRWGDIDDYTCHTTNSEIYKLEPSHLYLMTYHGKESSDCIILGLYSQEIEKIQKELELVPLLNMISKLPGIHQVSIESHPSDHGSRSKEMVITFEDTPDKSFAQTQMPFGNDYLIVILDITHFKYRMIQLRQETIGFSVILGCLGLLFSFILYRIQGVYLHRIQLIERDMAQQKKDAALGRAAATITHEIRNPLNAISMGLQRLDLEADTLSDEYRTLIGSLLKAVQRANRIVADMRRYAGPLTIHKQIVRIAPIIDHILKLYHSKISDQKIDLQISICYQGTVVCDPVMMEEVFENLVKNAIEAQPNGGYIRLILDREKSDLMLSIENRGFNADKKNPEQILEPYFTTKSKGTGLGLTIVQRIVHAHNGRLAIQVSEPDIFTILVMLPILNEVGDSI